MNVPVIAIKCGIDNEFFLGGELHRFAEAVIEEYKARLEPVAYMWQHEETGNIGFTDQWQIDNGFKENNPRLNIIAPLYALLKETK